ncbi:MAG: hypothetical protein ACOC0V_00070 [Oceanicaulis sp.]
MLSVVAAALMIQSAPLETEDYQRQSRVEVECEQISADSNGDGVLTREEYRQYRQDSFDNYDLDQNEEIDLIEAETCWIRDGSGRERAEFEDFDLNDDEIVGYEEYHAEGWWEDADENSDGMITPDEWPEGFGVNESDLRPPQD